jgi:hypothetical protein
MIPANKLIELNGGEEDYQDSEEKEDATLPKSELPSFASIIGPRIYNVVSKPTLYFVFPLIFKLQTNQQHVLVNLRITH